MHGVSTPAVSVSDAARTSWKYFVPIWLFGPVLVLVLSVLQHFHVAFDGYVIPVVILGLLSAQYVSRRPVQRGAITQGQWFALAVAATFLAWVCFVIAFMVIGVLLALLLHAH